MSLDQPEVTRGIAIGDMDHDGDLDFINANQWGPTYIYRNKYIGENDFLGLRVMQAVGDTTREVRIDPVSKPPLKFAIGTVANLILPDGKFRIGYVDGSNGHSGKNSNEIFFGLGKSQPQRQLALILKWRDRKGAVQETHISLTSGLHTIVLPE